MCNCIDEVNAKLAERNTRLSEPMFLFGADPSVRRLFIATEQIETGRGKQKTTAMFNSFCPFCGEKLAEDGTEKIKPTLEERKARLAPPEPEDSLSRTCYRGKTVEDGEIVLVHWPEGYRLRYHGETVWREPEVPKPDLTAN